MAEVRVAVMIDRPPAVVWADVADIASHVEWMHDAVSIEFRTEQRTGIGTSFDCETRVGPLRTTDRMTITEWADERRMGVRHEGVVTGEGHFELQDIGGTQTRFSWTERLDFPWFFGGPLGELAARPVLAAIWRRNLRALKARIESSTD